MNERTIAALARLNSSFYSGSAERFSRTRQAPWPGWSRVLETWSHPDAGSTMPEAPSILDAGCGNGRFGVLLDRVLEPPYSYLGVDSSVPLLDIARSTVADREGVELRFVMADLVDEGLDGKLGELRFDLIVVFGVLHHIPSLKARRSLLLRLGRRLAPGGLMALTMWQFAVPDRFRARFMSWEDYNRQAEEPLDLAENLALYLSALTQRILERHGTVDKFIGDAVMAFWGAPLRQDDHAERAVRSALSMMRNLYRWNDERRANGQETVAVRIAIHSGPVVVGDIGSKTRVDYTVLGNTVNIAARLEEYVALPGQVVIGDTTQAAIAHLFPTERLDDVPLKGLSRKIAVYRLALEAMGEPGGGG